MRSIMLVDLHTHTTFSDGNMTPAELVRRYEAAGYAGVALTDHADMTNCDFVVERLLRAAGELTDALDIAVRAGAEVTHVPPSLIGSLVERCRRAGAQVVLVHGETIVEPVAPGTNRAAIEAGVDVLAHPGLISDQDACAAAAAGVRLELTGRKGHSLTNGHVAALARRLGAKMTYGTDLHGPEDLNSAEQVRRVLRGAGLDEGEIDGVLRNNRELIGLRGE